MKVSVFFMLLVILSGGTLLAACAGGTGAGDGESSGSDLEHPDPPEGFAGLTNPYQGDQEMAAEGEVLFQANCSSCHGMTGEGDGPAAAGLEPKPRNLAEVQGDLSDDYLFWRISEGGLMSPFNSVMPAWRGILSDDRIWAIITYIRTLEG